MYIPLLNGPTDSPFLEPGLEKELVTFLGVKGGDVSFLVSRSVLHQLDVVESVLTFL